MWSFASVIQKGGKTKLMMALKMGESWRTMTGWWRKVVWTGNGNHYDDGVDCRARWCNVMIDAPVA